MILIFVVDSDRFTVPFFSTGNNYWFILLLTFDTAVVGYIQWQYLAQFFSLASLEAFVIQSYTEQRSTAIKL